MSSNEDGTGKPTFGQNMTLLAKASMIQPGLTEESEVQVFAMAGSLLDFESPQHGCIVNAANNGGVTGFGIDERINRAAGDYEIKQARKALGGIPTGTAKSTPAFAHSHKVPHIIHACGPVLRANALSNEDIEAKYAQLSSAYTAALHEADRLGCREVAFCLISAGVFRGDTSLNTVIRLGLEGITNYYRNQEASAQTKPRNVILFAYTREEQRALQEEVLNFRVSEEGQGDDVC